ncbi:MAG TPA: DUF4142 domain-containing protein [Qipengyuania sp.]|nr:DUF4142 domain-containing protein [Qipengyuania sp.]
MNRYSILAATATLLVAGAPSLAAEGPSDAQIAHIAYTAGTIDIAAAKQALRRSHDPMVRAFAEEMIRDHEAVNQKALALVKELGVTPADNPTSAALSKDGEEALQRLSALSGRAYDRAYVANEIAYHGIVNGALKKTLIPSADNAQLKSLLETGLTLFGEHQKHAEHLAQRLK